MIITIYIFYSISISGLLGFCARVTHQVAGGDSSANPARGGDALDAVHGIGESLLEVILKRGVCVLDVTSFAQFGNTALVGNHFSLLNLGLHCGIH